MLKPLVPFVKKESKSSLALFQMFHGIGLNRQILNYGLKVQQRRCLKNDGESKKKWRMIVSYKDNQQLELI